MDGPSSSIGCVPIEATVARLDPIERFETSPDGFVGGGAVRIGLVFGPRALRKTCGRPLEVVRARGIGGQRQVRRCFADARSIARFWTSELNASLRRARIATRVRAGAVAALERDEAWPCGPHPGTRLVDLFEGRVRAPGGAMPLECWAYRAQVNCVLVLVDWNMYRSRIERGAWAGFAPAPAALENRRLVFHPVAIVDLRCALTAHSLSHEFGHLLGCVHDNEPGGVPRHARGFAAPGRPTFSVMAAAREMERGRRLEWSRPHPRGRSWQFGDAEHHDAAWLRVALPLLARQRFRCSGVCGGTCGRAAALLASG